MIRKRLTYLGIFVLSLLNTLIVINRLLGIDKIADGWILLVDYLYVLSFSLALCILALLIRNTTVFLIQIGYIIFAFISINIYNSLYSVYSLVTVLLLFYHLFLLIACFYCGIQEKGEGSKEMDTKNHHH